MGQIMSVQFMLLVHAVPAWSASGETEWWLINSLDQNVEVHKSAVYASIRNELNWINILAYSCEIQISNRIEQIVDTTRQ